MTARCAHSSGSSTDQSGQTFESFVAFNANEYPTLSYDHNSQGYESNCAFVITSSSDYKTLVEQSPSLPPNQLTPEMVGALVGSAIALYALVAVINSILVTMGYKR